MENKSICKNPWCKSTYTYVGDNAPGVCHKCVSFDTQMSGGVSWGTKNYTEPRNDGQWHEVSINILNEGGKNKYLGIDECHSNDRSYRVGSFIWPAFDERPPNKAKNSVYADCRAGSFVPWLFAGLDEYHTDY